MGFVMSFIIALITLFIVIPLRSMIFIVKQSIKFEEFTARARARDNNKRGYIVDEIIKGKRALEKNMTESQLVRYRLLRLTLTALRVVLRVVRGVIFILSIITIGTLIFLLLVFAVLLVACYSVIAWIDGEGDISAFNPSSGGTEQTCQSKAVDYLKACEEVWLDWHNKGYDYSQSTRQDSDYGGTIRCDCSGYVYATLQKMGYFELGSSPFNTMGMKSEMSKIPDLDCIKYTDGMELKPGDICVVYESHTQVYVGNGLWWNNGSSGKLPNNTKPFNANYFLGRMKNQGGYVYRWKETKCPDKESGGTNNNFSSNQEAWCTVAKDCMKVIASYKFKYYTEDYKMHYVDEFGTFMRADCSGIILAFAQMYGAYDLYPDGVPITFYTGNMAESMCATGYFYQTKVSTADELQAGDVVVGPHHTQLYMGDGLWINGGNTKSLAKPEPAPSYFFKPSYKIVRAKEGVPLNIRQIKGGK